MTSRRATPARKATAGAAATRSGAGGRHAAAKVADGPHRLTSPDGTTVTVQSDDVALALTVRGFVKS